MREDLEQIRLVARITHCVIMHFACSGRHTHDL